MDFILSLLALVVLFPLLVLTALLIQFDLGSPVLFVQKRPCIHKKIFDLYKFRTMINKTDKNGNFLPDNIRLTKFGKLLRSTSLDELPELINILKGEMSIVGPRPLLVQYLPLYNEHQRKRHLVRPGLTGYAQVNGRNTLKWEDKFNLDIEYVKNITFVGDWKIIIKTLKNVIFREGINSNNFTTMIPFTGSKGK
jgi:lipopolysaccharide/colanic/teichoic acid biosynthesis glycosyltransferase